MRTTKLALAVGGLSAGLLLTVPAVASAHPKPAPTPVVMSTALAAPFNLEVKRHSVLVADGGLNLVGRLKANGTIGTIARPTSPGRPAWRSPVAGSPSPPP